MKKRVSIGIIPVLASILIILLYTNTGFLQGADIDKRDLANWKYDSNGVIMGSEGFILNGSSGECWVFAHGYTTTPDELRIVAAAINKEFNDTVYVPRLLGHATVPSNIEKYSVNDWYDQLADIAQEHNCRYLLGSSMGSSIVLRYAEEHHPRKIVLAGLTLEQPTILPAETLVRILYPTTRYLKRTEPGETIEDPEGKRSHISTYSFPLKGVVELYDFNKVVVKDLSKVDAQALFLHGTRDKAAGIDAAREAYDQISSKKEFFEADGSHIVFRDYSKEMAVDAVLAFRRG